MIKTREDLIKAYVKFFKSKKHVEIPSASLIPENDPTVLFTTAGMHPLVPYLMGQAHPLGKRLCDVQKCIRTGDIDEVGDEVHHTFFEMLGNWSFGDYFKEDAIKFSFEFLTSKKWLGIPVERLAVSVFAGDKDCGKDKDAAEVWKSLGISEKRIAFLGKKDNWWGPAGETGPCGPDTEMFYFTGEKVPAKFDPEDKRWVEIWNDVFMQYEKDKRLILVDGMHCLYDNNFKLNEELLKIINNFNTHTVLVVNGFREKGLSLIKNYDSAKDTNWEAFSLEENEIKKDNPEYFKILLKKFNLVPEEVMYFDHDKKNVDTASKLGILSKHYTDVNSIKKFIEKNLWAYIPLKQKNVDTGLGVERVVAVLNGLSDNYLTSCFKPVIKKIEKISGKDYLGREKEMRIIADHLKAAVFILGDARGIKPANVGQGYVLRRLIRRAVRYGRMIGIKEEFLGELAKEVIGIYGKSYDELVGNRNFVLSELRLEEGKFGITLEKGLRKFGSFSSGVKKISGKDAFLLFQSYGFPIEMTLELAEEKNVEVDVKRFEKEFEKHQKLSRTASAGTFKSGLSDNSEMTKKLHTATHLLNAALKIILGSEEIKQKGSNINSERLRFDFSFDRKLADDEKREVEELVNSWIEEDLKVEREEMSVDDAIKNGAQAEFGAKYPEIVSVYTIGHISKEICTGPHIENLKSLGHFKIKKEESSSAGVRRIKATISAD